VANGRLIAGQIGTQLPVISSHPTKYFMKNQSLFQSAIAAILLIGGCFSLPAQAQEAKAAIKPYGTGSIRLIAPTVAAGGNVNTKGSTQIALDWKGIDGKATNLTLATGDPKTAAKVVAILAGTIQGLGRMEATPEQINNAIALVAPLAAISKPDAIAETKLTADLVLLMGLLNNPNKDKNSINLAIVTFNNLVKTSSPEVLRILNQQPEFIAIHKELIELRATVAPTTVSQTK
jgi:hypothetical protein